MLVKDYAIVCMILGLVSTAFGQKVMSRMVKKTKRNSYIAFSIGVVVLLSALLMTLQSVLHMMSDKVDEEFSGICAAHLNNDPSV
jgi:ABC-type bacteriocin/lantibiotic exporter with double-glycine peptidase domain